jgi:membrane-associated phospholipid phosphatase
MILLRSILRELGLARPSNTHFLYAFKFQVILAVLFEVVYLSTNYLTSLHSHRLRLHFDFELLFPFFPAWAGIYLSLWGLVLSIPFVLGNPVAVQALSRTIGGQIAIAGPCFLLFPSEAAFPKHILPSSITTSIYEVARNLSLDHNMLPSLHATFAVTIGWIFGTHTPLLGKAAFLGWAILICLSTVLTHQHHMIDIVAGLALSWITIKLIYNPMIKQAMKEVGDLDPAPAPADHD